MVPVAAETDLRENARGEAWEPTRRADILNEVEAILEDAFATVHAPSSNTARTLASSNQRRAVVPFALAAKD